MRVPFLDLAAQHLPLREEMLRAWGAILDSSDFVSGSEVAAFEEEFAAAHQVEHCVAVSTGTEALGLALRALEVRAGERVVVPANTFIATAEAVSNAGATPLLVDCDATRNIDVAAAREALDHGDVAGVIGVHLYGMPADFDALNEAAAEHGLWAIEDAAQAHLATMRGRFAGGLGDLAAFSFYPGKNLGAPGEGGAITTSDEGLAATLRKLRSHGESARYHHDLVGTNARMTELVATTLRIKLRHLAEWTEARRRHARRYRDNLSDAPGVRLPVEPAWAESSYHLFTVEVSDRDRVRKALDQAGVGTGMHYPIPIHLQPAYRHLGHEEGEFPESETNAAGVLSLPMFPELTDAQIDYVCAALRDAVEQGA